MAGRDVTGATVLVTGATSGIGLATARVLAARVGHLVVHGPQPADQVASVLADLRGRLARDATLTYLSADYGHLEAVAELATAVIAADDRLDVVVNNAGVPGPPNRTTTADGNELTLQVDYLAPVALSWLLLDHLARQASARIVNVASATHLSASLELDDLDLRHGYSPVAAYARSKLALVTASCRQAAHVPDPAVEVVSLHPGVIATDLLHAMFGGGGDRPDQAADAVVEVAERSDDSGTYYDCTRPADPHPLARDRVVQDRLHRLTVERLHRAGLDIDADRT